MVWWICIATIVVLWRIPRTKGLRETWQSVSAQKRRRTLLALEFGLVIAVAGAIDCASRYHTSSLSSNVQWVSGKVSLSRGVMGAVAYLMTHTSTATDSLNL